MAVRHERNAPELSGPALPNRLQKPSGCLPNDSTRSLLTPNSGPLTADTEADVRAKILFSLP